MRSLILPAVLLALSLRICGDDPPPAQPTAIEQEAPGSAAPSAPAAPVAHHGGAVTVVGTHSVEVVARSDGHLEAYVAGPEGAVPPPASVTISVEAPGADTQTHAVELVWDPTDLRYEGSIGVAPAPGPIVVHLTAGSAPPVVASVVVVRVEPIVRVGPPPGVVAVQAPGAGVVVNAPRVYAVPGEVEVDGDIELRGPGAVFVAPPPPPGFQIGVNVGVVGGVEVDDEGEYRVHREHMPHGHDHDEHGHHGH